MIVDGHDGAPPAVGGIKAPGNPRLYEVRGGFCRVKTAATLSVKASYTV